MNLRPGTRTGGDATFSGEAADRPTSTLTPRAGTTVSDGPAPAHGQPWIIVPAFQARQTLADVLRRIPRDLNAHTLVIDDGSTDATGTIASEMGIDLLRNPRNLGYAQTQKRGMRHALANGATMVAVLHADGQYPPESLPEVLTPLQEGRADVVLGSRLLDGMARRRGMPLYKWIANRGLTALENRCYGLTLSEYHTGMMAYSRRSLEIIPFGAVSDTFHFDGEMAMLAGRRGLRIEEISIPHVYGSERSHLKVIPYGLSVVAIALAVRLGLYDRWLDRRATGEAMATPPG